jgi:hypothetical protein
MEDKSINKLIKELKDLQLHEAKVLALIEKANKRRDQVAGHHGVFSKHRTTNIHGFEQGDQIRITNPVTKPHHWGDTPCNYLDAQRAMVTFTTVDQIYFVTDNSVNTWRAPQNLK